MINFLLQLFSICKYIFFNALFLSQLLGHVLTKIGYFLLFGLYTTLHNLCVISVICYEDFIVFAYDVVHSADTLWMDVYGKLDNIFSIMLCLLSNIAYFVEAFKSWSTYICALTYNNVTGFLNLFKRYLVLTGDGAWLGIILIPSCFQQAFLLIINIMSFIYNMAFDAINKTFIIIASMLYYTYTYFTDIKPSTLAGLMILTLSFYLLKKYHWHITRLLHHVIQMNRLFLQSIILQIIVQRREGTMRLQNVRIRNIGQRDNIPIEEMPERYNVQPVIQARLSPNTVHERTPQGDDLSINANSNLPERNNSLQENRLRVPDAGLCVICREREKNILMWPCRHLCLCSECLDLMEENYDNRCPLCRTVRMRTIPVYV